MDEPCIILRLNYDEQTLKDKDIRKVFEGIPEEFRKYIYPNFQRVWQTGKPNVTGEENRHRLDIINHCYKLGYPQNSPANVFEIGGNAYKCYADRYFHTEINWDGTVYSCTARAYTKEYEFGELLNSGIVEWNEEKMAQKLANATFENDMCEKCKYLPLCFGPCSQKIMETPLDKLEYICALKQTEIKPETVIIDYYRKKEKLIMVKA